MDFTSNLINFQKHQKAAELCQNFYDKLLEISLIKLKFPLKFENVADPDKIGEFENFRKLFFFKIFSPIFKIKIEDVIKGIQQLISNAVQNVRSLNFSEVEFPLYLWSCVPEAIQDLAIRNELEPFHAEMFKTIVTSGKLLFGASNTFG